ncbi:MAG: phosphate ABC transporter substrate-binding/OmpA family protein [Planctomycetota bacterium]
MADKKVTGYLLAAALWIVLLGILAMATKYFVMPYFEDELEDETGSESRYQYEITVATDSFSGYSILRSPVMKSQLKGQGCKLTVHDDQADLESRMEALSDGDLQMAVFTVDSLLTLGARYTSFPGSIVMIIDETKGADAMVAYRGAVDSLQDLDDPKARIVLTPRSPSEFLARTVIAHFNLPNLPDRWWVEAEGAGDVYRKFRSADKTKRIAYALWEPYVSKALEIPDAHLLLDSSKLKGFIVDVLVAERRFLRDHPDRVKALVEAYFQAAYAYGCKAEGMQQLVMDDAKTLGAEALTSDQAGKLVKGIEWKNTLENYAYFGLLPAGESKGMQHIEDIINNITSVLIKTGALKNDPIEGKAHTLFYDKILRELQASGFHPGKKVNVIDGLGLGMDDLDGIRNEAVSRALSDAEWASLIPVGEMRIKPISFARGTARINIQSQRDLAELSRNLKAWPQYYLIVTGHARAEGDKEANLKLAKERAGAAADYIVSTGIDASRIRPDAALPRGGNGEAQTVSFILGQVPY